MDHFCPELERTFLTTIINDKGKITLRGSADRNDDPNYKNPLADPRVEKFSRFILFKDDYVVTDNRRFTVQTMVADSLYLEMMPHPVVEGTSALRNPNDAIITRKLARRLFKGESPMGKTLKVSTGDWVTITGVIDEPATKASMTFELLLSYNLRTNWSRIDYELVQLHRAEDVAALNEKNRQPMELISYSKRPVYYQLTPLKGFYLNPAVHSFEPVVRGNRTSLNILTVVAALLLLIGIFNYTNLHTVVMLRRAREFGIKKVFGANGRAVFLQLYFENFCIGAVALLFVWTLVEVTRSIVATWFEIPVVSDAAFDLGVSACLLFGMPLLTSIFPFVRYNYAAPTRSLRSIGRGGNSVVSRMAFLFIQYAITVSLVVVAVYFCRQLYYVLHYDLNYQKENIILCPLFARDTSYDIASEEEWQKQREKEKADIELVRRRMDESPLFTKWTYGELPIRIPPPIWQVRHRRAKRRHWH